MGESQFLMMMASVVVKGQQMMVSVLIPVLASTLAMVCLEVLVSVDVLAFGLQTLLQQGVLVVVQLEVLKSGEILELVSETLVGHWS